jgi:hypothetical protein
MTQNAWVPDESEGNQWQTRQLFRMWPPWWMQCVQAVGVAAISGDVM